MDNLNLAVVDVWLKIKQKSKRFFIVKFYLIVKQQQN